MPSAGQRVLAADFRPSVTDFDSTTLSNISTTASAGSPVVAVTFTAPTSGKALVIVSGRIQDNGGSNSVAIDWVLKEDNSSGDEILATGSWERRLELQGDNNTNSQNASKVFLVESLTPGQVYYAEVRHYALTGTTADVITRQITVIPQPA